MCIIAYKIEISNNSVIKDAFDSISRIIDEIIIEINEDGFQVNALDRSHISYVGLKLDKEFFDEFDCKDTERICIDTTEFMQILKRMKKNDTLRLSDDENNNIVITLIGDSTRTFKIRLIDLEYDTPAPPSINPPCRFEIESNLLKDCLGDMELFGDVITYRINHDYFIAESNGEFGDSSFKYIHGEDINEEVKSKYSIDKLKDILTASKFSPICEMLLGNDMPLILRFELETGDGELRFLLAPRLEEDI